MWDSDVRNNYPKHTGKKMLDQGSNMVRFIDTYESAWNIVDLIFKKDPERSGRCPQEGLVGFQECLPEVQTGIPDS